MKCEYCGKRVEKLPVLRMARNGGKYTSYACTECDKNPIVS
jgi:DNA-directed RNA polymerase subunit RPC12/RpoP